MKLKVLNKVSFGVELALALDSAKPREGDNLVSLGVFKADSKYNVGDTVEVKVTTLEPILTASKWSITTNNLEVIDKCDGKPSTAREAIKEALNNNSLKLPEDCSVLEDLKLVKNNQTLPNAEVNAQGNVEKNEVQLNKTFSIIKDDSKRLVYGVVYEPFNGSNLDAHGDYATAEEIEKTAHQYLEKFGEVSFMHEQRINDQAKVVESFIAPCDYKQGNETIKKGAWVMVTHVLNDKLWKMIQDGEIDAYSIEGVGQEGPSLMKTAIVKSEKGTIVKRNLINMTIDAVALVDKGANKKKFYLKKSSKEQFMDKELALLLIKALIGKPELQAQIIKALPEADQAAAQEAAKQPEAKPEVKPEDKKPEVMKMDPAMLKEIVAAVLAELKATEAAEEVPVEDGCSSKDVKKYLENENLEIPEELVAEVIKQLKI